MAKRRMKGKKATPQSVRDISKWRNDAKWAGHSNWVCAASFNKAQRRTARSIRNLQIKLKRARQDRSRRKERLMKKRKRGGRNARKSNRRRSRRKRGPMPKGKRGMQHRPISSKANRRCIYKHGNSLRVGNCGRSKWAYNRLTQNIEDKNKN